MEIEQLVKKLGLRPHPEGGFYTETYRSSEFFGQEGLPERFSGPRNFSTAIYFLMTADSFSAFHRIKSDEIWHFYLGDPLEVIEIDETGNCTSTIIGNELSRDEIPQYTVKSGRWFGSRVKKGGRFSLVGCTVSPGFDFTDFEMGVRSDLTAQFPACAKIIAEMTRD